MSTGTRNDCALGALAEAMGILLHWRDPVGVEHVAGPDTQRALLAAMGVAAESEADEAGAES